MKGIVFSELLNWIETTQSAATVDAVIERSDVPNDGAYTSVGNYPHTEALSLLVALSQISDIPVGTLARSYGHWLAGRFAVLYPELVGIYPDAQSLLAGVGTHIHLEVTKLYPEANPPRIETIAGEHGLEVHYASHRPFADIAHGLIEGFIAHFGEDLAIARENLAEDGTSTRFVISEN